ncbi:acyl-CoA dehydrogenase family protein [Cohnella abietis]|uniref:Dibenzothiophene monooxygenase n=1 Tax=Cohnella abietis TaxID=2507935 RepID=A0A3T1DBU5_9BACL|nr:acyl-CoA dehydrogenase family protein [Cohnella abietis]BBI35580.1 SfnB family sulfur acquisition oxidoreductase [Cohnella abietis]
MSLYEDQLLKTELFDLTDDQYQLLLRFRQIGEQIIGPAAKQVDEEGRFPFEGANALKQEELGGLCVPSHAGGLGVGYGGDAYMLPLILMELASWCSSLSQVFGVHNTAVQMIHAMGNDEQRDFFFSKALQGDWFASFASETGPNRFNIASKVTPDGDGYLLNARKSFATASTGADWAFIWSMADGIDDSLQEQVVFPLLKLDDPGVTINDSWDGIGQRGTGSGTVIAENVTIPPIQMIGEPGSYFRYDYFNHQFHLNFAAQYVGIAIGAYRQALQFMKERARPWSGLTSATEDPYIQLRIGEMSVQLQAARQFILHAARLLQKANEQEGLWPIVHIAVAQAKVFATEAALDITSRIFQVMGASSATQKNNFDVYFRNARTLTLHDPIDRRKEVIGKSELGYTGQFDVLY